MNIVTKSGTNALHGEALYMARPGGCRRRPSRPTASAPPSVSDAASTPATLTAINPADMPDELNQFSGSIGGPIVKDKTFFFATADYTRQDRTTFLSNTLPAFVLPPDGSLDLRRPLPADARQRPAGSQAHADSDADGAGEHRSLLRHQPATTRWSAPTRRPWRAGTRASRGRRRSITPRSLGANLLNEARVAYLNGDPVTLWEAQALSTTYTRSGSVPFTIGESRSADLFGHQVQFADTLSWSRGRHNLRFGGSLDRITRPAARAASPAPRCSARSRSSTRRPRRSIS